MEQSFWGKRLRLQAELKILFSSKVRDSGVPRLGGYRVEPSNTNPDMEGAVLYVGEAEVPSHRRISVLERGSHRKPGSPAFLPSDPCMRTTQFPHTALDGQCEGGSFKFTLTLPLSRTGLGKMASVRLQMPNPKMGIQMRTCMCMNFSGFFPCGIL